MWKLGGSERMRRKLRFFLYYDPIEELISRQLSSLWLENIFLNLKPKGHKAWDYQFHKNTEGPNIDNMEDQFISAIDRKYNAPYRRRDTIFEMMSNGFTQEEIAALLGITRITVVRDLLKGRDKDGKD